MEKSKKIAKCASTIEIITSILLFLFTACIVVYVFLKVKAVNNIFLTLAVLAIVTFSQAVITIIDGSISFKKCKDSDEKYLKNITEMRNMGIAFLVICIAVFICAPFSFSGNTIIKVVDISYIVICAFYLTIAICKLRAVVLAKEKTNKQKVKFEKAQDQLLENVFDRLALLNQMFNEGLITQEEYSILKNRIISTHFSNKK